MVETTPAKVFTLVYVLRADGRILMMRRGQQTHINRGRLSAPGGKVEPCEGVLEAAARELVEETGLKAKKLTYRGCSSYTNNNPNNPAGHIHLITVTEFEGELKASDREGVLAWLTLDEIMADPSFTYDHQHILQQILQTDHLVAALAVWENGEMKSWACSTPYYAERASLEMVS